MYFPFNEIRNICLGIWGMNVIHLHSACSILHSVTNILKENSLCKELEWQALQAAVWIYCRGSLASGLGDSRTQICIRGTTRFSLESR